VGLAGRYPHDAGGAGRGSSTAGHWEALGRSGGVWPLWFAALAFVHTRRAGALLVLGLAVAATLRIA